MASVCRITLAFPHLISGDATRSAVLTRCCCRHLCKMRRMNPREADEVFFLSLSLSLSLSSRFFLSLPVSFSLFPLSLSSLFSFSLLFSLIPLLLLSLFSFALFLPSFVSFLSISFSFPCLFVMHTHPPVCARSLFIGMNSSGSSGCVCGAARVARTD